MLISNIARSTDENAVYTVYHSTISLSVNTVCRSAMPLPMIKNKVKKRMEYLRMFSTTLQHQNFGDTLCHSLIPLPNVTRKMEKWKSDQFLLQWCHTYADPTLPCEHCLLQHYSYVDPTGSTEH